MKKIYLILAVAALTLCAASCGNNKKAAKEAEPAATELAAPAEASVVDSTKVAAETGIDAAASAAQEAIKGE